MLQLLDIFLYTIHIIIILYCLFGWTIQRYRRVHLVTIGTIAGCWFGLGLWYGMGYCPLTDWHWQLKRLISEEPLPNSFIKHILDMILPAPISDSMADTLAFAGFITATVISIYLQFIRKTSCDQEVSPNKIPPAD